MLPQITLTTSDVRAASRMGALRFRESRRQGLLQRAGAAPNMDQDIDGTLAEIAFARYIGVPANVMVNTFHLPDIAGVQVRSTSRADGRLIVRECDSDTDWYALVVGAGREWRVCGVIRGIEAKRDQFWYDGRNGRPGCWMVPQQFLRNVSLSLMAHS